MQRYLLCNQHLSEGGGWYMEEDSDGDWVRYDDATVSLNQMLAKAREDAIREAAHLIECDGDALGGKSGAAKAILALLNDGGRDE